MKLLVVLTLFVLLALATQPVRSQQANPPLTKDQVMDLVKFGMDSSELAKRIKERGIDFEPSDEYLEALRKAGAKDPVIQAIRQVKPRPLSREQVGELVAGGVPSQRATALVKQRGIDFQADEHYLDTLRVAGADETLIATLREASAAVTAELVVVTLPDAEVYLDGAPQGRADSLGLLGLKASPGAHTLKVTLSGKRTFELSVTLAPQQPFKIEARLEDMGGSPGQVRENPKDNLNYVWIPPGSFMMGCSPGDNECADSEKPSHQVTITHGFWIGQTEVTVRAYKRFVGITSRQMPPAPDFNNAWMKENMPIVSVTWDDAQAYCGWVRGRLPTEAEWEYAARGGSSEARYGAMDGIAWHGSNSSNQAHDVAQKSANGFGLYDVLGNVREWVNDWYDEHYFQNSPSQDPQGPAGGKYRVMRGGSWVGKPENVRVSSRVNYDPAYRHAVDGFRCAREDAGP